MSWIKTVAYEASTGKLRTLYDRIKGPNNYIDNILLLHSLRPHTLEGHMALYKSTLHHAHNQYPKWMLECIGIYVSIFNGCHYCVEHHFAGLRRLLKDNDRADEMRQALEVEYFEQVFENREVVILKYVKQLTLNPWLVDMSLIDALFKIGLDDGEILEINQVASYFAYANRTVLGLGCSTEGDILGLSPGDGNNSDNWEHG